MIMMKAMSNAEDGLTALKEIRNNSGNMDTIGLSDEVIEKFCKLDSNLLQAISEGLSNHRELRNRLGDEVMQSNEIDLVSKLQEDFVNFYAPATVNPYVAMAAKGPWIITSHGAVVHDNGGMGCLVQDMAPLK